ncbi:hypothetical protein GGF42_007294 [Coemansia sp. RSA 2424]|nr:hypothetical protein GGF42_007294 [Coemansia sp. RSA 2424]
MGIDLATQNQALTTKLSELSQEQETLRQRLDLVERDRRWMQDQSLRVDQVRASLNELLAKNEGNRSRYAATELRIDGLTTAVAKLRDNVDEQTRALDSVASVLDAQSAISSQGLRLTEVDESVTKNESRRRTQATETMRVLSELSGRVSSSEALQRETQAQMDWVSSHQRELQESLQSVVREYNTMLNEHEQAIRILGDSHAVLESQVCLSQQSSSAVIHTPMSIRNKGSGGGSGLPTPASSAPSIARQKPRTTPESPVEENHYSDAPNSPITPATAPASTARPNGVAAGRRRNRDSGIYTVPVMRGESLGDIFANDTMTSHNDDTNSLEIADRAVVLPPAAVSRKAASVAGAPSASGERSNRGRSRPRNSSFSRDRVAPTSPARMAGGGGGLGNILSSSAHVGVGWGNYWEARRHRLQFDIQKRLSISAAAAAISTLSNVDDFDIEE